jgi:hypothetical protein
MQHATPFLQSPAVRSPAFCLGGNSNASGGGGGGGVGVGKHARWCSESFGVMQGSNGSNNNNNSGGGGGGGGGGVVRWLGAPAFANLWSYVDTSSALFFPRREISSGVTVALCPWGVDACVSPPFAPVNGGTDVLVTAAAMGCVDLFTFECHFGTAVTAATFDVEIGVFRCASPTVGFAAAGGRWCKCSCDVFFFCVLCTLPHKSHHQHATSHSASLHQQQ